MGSLNNPKSPTLGFFSPLSNLTISSTLSPSNTTVTTTSTSISSPSININSLVLTPNSGESSVTQSPPILPPRLLKNENVNNLSFVEATAPPRPPKPSPQTPQSASTNKSEGNMLDLSLFDQNNKKTMIEQNLAQGVELENNETFDINLAPPLPPKPLKQLVKKAILDT